jgi:hypothetical protein
VTTIGGVLLFKPSEAPHQTSGGAIVKWVLRIYAVSLLVYTGFRTWRFLQTTLPASESGQFVSLVFLLAAEIGLILWHELSLRSTTGRQNSIANVMTWTDFAASTAAGIADMLIGQSLIEGYQIPPMLGMAIIYGLPLVMAANVAAAILFFNADSDEQLDKSRRMLKHTIHAEAMTQVQKQQKAVAKGLAPELTAQIESEVIEEVRTAIIGEPSTNGRVRTYASEAETERPKERVRK